MTESEREEALRRPALLSGPLTDFTKVNEDFSAWVKEISPRLWAKFDLSAARIGWEAALARQGYVPLSVYESAVKGRQEFRQAYRDARQSAPQQEPVGWIIKWSPKATQTSMPAWSIPYEMSEAVPEIEPNNGQVLYFYSSPPAQPDAQEEIERLNQAIADSAEAWAKQHVELLATEREREELRSDRDSWLKIIDDLHQQIDELRAKLEAKPDADMVRDAITAINVRIAQVRGYRYDYPPNSPMEVGRLEGLHEAAHIVAALQPDPKLKGCWPIERLK